MEATFTDYEAFNKAKCACRECPIGPVYDKVVPSVGNTESPTVMLIGEAPGREEVEHGEPFIGKAGALLREVLGQNGFNRDNTLITNTIPCRPENNKFPKDQILVTSCKDKWLMEEIRLTNPKIIGIIGSQALKYVMGMQGITNKRGQWFKLPGSEIDCLATFHPSYVLRKQHMKDGNEIVLDFRKDLRAIAEKAGFN